MSTDDGSSCLTGQFLSEHTVRNTFVNGVKRKNRAQRVFPDIHFSCNATITQWIIGGEMRMGSQNFLELQVWQGSNDDEYIRKSFSIIDHFNATENSNVYEYSPNPPLEVQEGDALGVFQPGENDGPLTIYYQENSGPFNYGNPSGGSNAADDAYTSLSIDTPLGENDYPLVSVILGEFRCETAELGFLKHRDKTSICELVVYFIPNIFD